MARPGLSLGARIFLITATLVALAVGTAVAVTYFFGNQVAQRTAREALERAGSVQAALQRQRVEQLRLIARVFVGDPALTAYVSEAAQLGENLSVLDLLEERQNDLGFDFAIVLDPQGKVLARTDQPDAAGDDLSSRPLVRKALEELEAEGFWEQDGRLFNAVAVPLAADRLLVGFLIAGFAIDDVAALDIRRVSDAEVAFLVGHSGADPAERPRIAASTLEPALGEELLAQLEQKRMVEPVMRQGQSMEHVDLELRGRRWIGLLKPLADAGGAPVGAVASLASLDAYLAPFRRIETILVVVGAAAVLLASLFSFLLSRRVMRPVRELARAAEAASEGNYGQRIAIGRNDEIGKLAQSFDQLLSELREKQDMETYISELSRTLPTGDGGGAGGGGARIEEAATGPVALLAADLRRYAGPKTGYDPEATVEQLARDLRRVQAAAGARQGRVEGTFGQRVLLSFEGEGRAWRALSAAAEIGAALSAATSSFDQAEPPVIAVTEGEAVSGSVVYGEGPARVLVGRPLQQLEGLLREGTPGDIVLSQSFYEGVGEAFARTGTQLSPQRGVFGGAATLYVMDRETAGRVGGVSVAAMGDSEQATLVQPATVGPGGAPGRAAAGAGPREAATLAEIAPGSLLGDRFEILSVLGAGGMGVVYKVRDRELDDLVALKMLKRDVWGDRELLDRLKSELKLARKITHPNVLRTFDFGEVNGIPFITMEYVRGITLRYLLSETGSLPYSAGLRLARQLCRGLAAAHEVGVLHRDIKPENLLVQPNGNAKLMDFGIARPLTRDMAAGQTQPGTVIGTPQYLAPEQLRGQEVDVRADLYACGVVFYEIFTAHTPFAGDNPMQIILNTLNEPPTPPRTYWPQMPEPLAGIILRCLDKDPKRRYRSADELLEELEALRA